MHATNLVIAQNIHNISLVNKHYFRNLKKQLREMNINLVIAQNIQKVNMTIWKTTQKISFNITKTTFTLEKWKLLMKRDLWI